MTDREGLYTKYIITKADGTPVNDRCFILKPDKDPAAIKALQAYAAATYNDQLRNDLYAWVGKPLDKPMQNPLTLDDVKNAGVVFVEYQYTKELRTAFVVKSANNRDFNVIAAKGTSTLRDCTLTQMSNPLFGKTWRAWASRPTAEEREAAPWQN